MASLYFDCTSGISGDMAVAALLDAGADKDELQAALDSIPASGFKTEITSVVKNGIAACDFNVILEHPNHDHDMRFLFGENAVESEHHHHEHSHEHHHEYEHSHEHAHHHEHRGLTEIFAIIESTKMSGDARALAKKIFDILAQAESKAHAKPKEEIHFHEVGALDSIVDIISLAVCYQSLKAKNNIARVYSTPLTEGIGTIRCAHGVLSVPVPAVANILAAHSIPLNIKNERGEFVTPTGAAFLAAINPQFAPPKNFTIKKIGVGAGKRAYENPSLLRAMLVEEAATLGDTITKLECNIDDCTGESLGFVQERLFEAGALDVTTIPCYMKKSRPAFLLQVICDNADVSKMESLVFEHTTTIGIRRVQMERTKLERRQIEIETPYGKINAKEVTVNGKTRVYPEYESVRKLCLEKNIGFAEVMNFI